MKKYDIFSLQTICILSALDMHWIHCQEENKYIYHLSHSSALGMLFIGVGRFRILGGAKGGPNSQQAHDVVMTS